MAHVWGWFLELSNMRDWGEGGPRAIKATEIAAWSDQVGTSPLPHEIRILLDMDVRFRNIHAEDEPPENLGADDRNMIAWVDAARMAASYG